VHQSCLWGTLDEECVLIPQADVLTALLANVIDYLVEHLVPRLWYYPSATQRSMLVMTSDDDWSTVEQFEAMIAALEERDGKCTFYLVPGSHTLPDLVHLWAKRGHRFSCHPDFSAMVSSAEKNHSAYTSFGLDEQVLHFPDIIRTTSDEIRERYGVPIHTVRQHAIRWQGYVDAARVLAAEGIKMETNYYSIQPFAASYMTGSGRPMKFVDENGEIIDVFQQATQVTEDTTIGAHSFAPHWPTDFVLDRMAGIMDASLGGYYTGITVNIHPVSFAGYARELAEGIWDLARERGIPIDSAEDWLDFTRSRYDAELTDISWDQSKLSFSVQLPAKTPQITVMWSSHGRTMESVAVDGIKHDFVVANLWGQEWILLTLEDVSTEARVEVRFV